MNTLQTDPWPFINSAYGVTILFLVGAAWLSFARLRRALRRLAQAERV